jgi:membrane protein YdbS with pleckstrin-like domain
MIGIGFNCSQLPYRLWKYTLVESAIIVGNGIFCRRQILKPTIIPLKLIVLLIGFGRDSGNLPLD